MDHLERDRLADDRLDGLVDRAHAALPELALDLVVAYVRTREQIGGRSPGTPRGGGATVVRHGRSVSRRPGEPTCHKRQYSAGSGAQNDNRHIRSAAG